MQYCGITDILCLGQTFFKEAGSHSATKATTTYTSEAQAQNVSVCCPDTT